MTTEELVDALRDEGYYLDLSVTQHREEPTEYTARFWHIGVKPTPPWIWDTNVNEVITEAAMTIIKRDGLDFHQDSADIFARDYPKTLAIIQFGVLLAVIIGGGTLIHIFLEHV